MATIILELRDQIARAPYAAIPDIVAKIYATLAAGEISEDEAGNLDATARQRQAALRGPQEAPGGRTSDTPRRPSIFPPKRLRERPDRAQARARRRHHARARWMPDHLADHLTDGELAALAVIAEEHAAHGACDLPMGKIAALAGVSESTARNGIRAAQALALITVEHRPRPGRPHLTNVMRIVSPAWLAWIRGRPASWLQQRGGGCKGFEATQKRRDNLPHAFSDSAQVNHRQRLHLQRQRPGQPPAAPAPSATAPRSTTGSACTFSDNAQDYRRKGYRE